MVKLIGIKELQTNTRRIREEAEKGVKFIVVYRSKPVFEINPISSGGEFADELGASGLYNDDFLKRMNAAEQDLKKGKTKEYDSTEDFLKSLT